MLCLIEVIECIVDWIDGFFGLEGVLVCDFGCGLGFYVNRYVVCGVDV